MIVFGLTDFKIVFNMFPCLYQIDKRCTSMTNKSVIVAGAQGANRNNDLFLLYESMLHLGSVTQSLLAFSETLTRLLAHEL